LRQRRTHRQSDSDLSETLCQAVRVFEVYFIRRRGFVFQTDVSAVGDDFITDQISLNFGKIEKEYIRQTVTGVHESVKAGWDVNKNEEIKNEEI